MGYTARDVMERNFLTLKPDMAVGQAVEVFRRPRQPPANVSLA